MGYIENNPTEKRFSKETGDVWQFGSNPNSVPSEQKIFDWVFN